MKVDLRLASQTRVQIDALAAAVRDLPEVMECVIVLGDWDFQLTSGRARLMALSQSRAVRS